MTSSIFNSEIGKLLGRIVLPYVAVMGIFCVLFDTWFANAIIFSVETQGPAKLQHLLAQGDPQEVPILGGSRANNGLVPQRIADHAWNYGINASGFPFVRMALQIELATDHKAPIVVGLDSDFFFNNQFGDPLDYIPFARDPRVWDYLQQQQEESHYYLLPTLRFYGGFERYMHRYLTQTGEAAISTPNSHGANLFASTIDHRVRQNADSIKVHEFGMADSSNVEEFSAIVEQHPGRCFVLVEMPYYCTAAQTTIFDKDFLRMRARLKQAPNVVWVDLPTTPLPYTAYQNRIHLNLEGAEWLSDTVRKKMDLAPSCR
jgi:hypothetical protein